MKKQGFTLIELLAVIVILAIIALIAVPIILNIIGSSKKSAVVRSGELYLKGVETTIARKNLNEQYNPTTCIIKSDGNLTCLDKDNVETDIVVEVAGSKPTDGIITLKKGKVTEVKEMSLTNYILEKKENERLKIVGSSDDNVEITITSSTSGSNHIVVQANISDPKITEIEYSKDNGATWEKGGTTYTFMGLENGTSYTLIAKITLKSGKEIISESITIRTNDLSEPTYSIDTNEVSDSKTVTINYPKIEGQTLTYEYSLDKGVTWQTATQTQQVTFTENGTIIARVTDGTNTVTANTFTVDNIVNYLSTNISGSLQKNTVESITVVNNKIIPSNSLGSFDVSESKNESIIAWYTDEDNNGLYELYIGGNGNVKANPNCENLFRSFSSAKTIDLTYLDTSDVTNMWGMFRECSSLLSLNINNFDTSKVTDFSIMFSDCKSLTSTDNIIGLNNLDTSNVVEMYGMFRDCSGLTSIDLNNFDTGEVTKMHSMFSGCSSLTSLNINGFDTSNVINMSGMFSNCQSLTLLNISGFNTSNVTDMTSMFSNCSSLTNLDLSNFDTGKVSNMGSMFDSCSHLTSLNVSSFNTSNVYIFNYMFSGCSSLTSLDVGNFDTSIANDMEQMFSGCSKLTTIDFRKASFNNVLFSTNDHVFYDCPKLTKIYVKDSEAKTKVNWCLSDSNKTGVTVTIV